jgi:hypothetical protein
MPETLENIVEKLRDESGITTGCPVCASGAFDGNHCQDCGVDILADWEAGR